MAALSNSTTFSKVTIVRGKRVVAVFEPAHVWDASDPTNPLHGDIRGPLSGAVVVSDGKRHIVALGTEVRQ